MLKPEYLSILTVLLSNIVAAELTLGPVKSPNFILCLCLVPWFLASPGHLHQLYLHMHDRQVFLFHSKEFKLFAPSQCWAMIEKANVSLIFLKIIPGVPGIRPVDGRPFKEVEVGDCVLEAVDRFCYLGDMLSAGGGCMAAATARCRCAWGKFRENLPLLTSKPVPFDLRGRLFSSNVRSSMLHGTETWPMTSAALHRLCRNDRAMIRWICGVKPSDDPSMDELHAKLGICDLAILVRERRLRWFGHVMRSNGEINRVRSRPVPGRKGPGRPKKTWEECVKQDLKVCGLSEAGTQDRLSWRSSVKNSRQEPTPSNGSLLQSMAAPPARRVLGMRTRSFNKTGFDWLIDWIPAWQGLTHCGLMTSYGDIDPGPHRLR